MAQFTLHQAIVEPSGPLSEINFFSREILAAPLGYLQKARREMPVVPVATSPLQPVEYLVTPYDLVQKVLTTPEIYSSDYAAILAGNANDDPRIAAIRAEGYQEVNSLLTADGKEHRRMRSLVAKAFTPARIRDLETSMRGVVADLVDDLKARSSIDFVQDFAGKLPANVLAHIMGLDKKQQADVQRWSAAITRRFGQMGTLDQRIEDEITILEAKRFIEALVGQRRGAPQGDLVTDLINAREEDEGRLSELEILATIFILFVGATETTFSTLNFAMAHLLENPELRAHLIANPEHVSAFNDEVLRYYTPVAGFWRVVLEDTQLGDTRLNKGSLIMVRVDSANRDPAMFSDPDRFDIHRSNNRRHLSFSGGAHACLGFRVAMMELNLAIPALLESLRAPTINREKTDFQVLPSSHSRCINALHIDCT